MLRKCCFLKKVLELFEQWNRQHNRSYFLSPYPYRYTACPPSALLVNYGSCLWRDGRSSIADGYKLVYLMHLQRFL